MAVGHKMDTRNKAAEQRLKLLARAKVSLAEARDKLSAQEPGWPRRIEYEQIVRDLKEMIAELEDTEERDRKAQSKRAYPRGAAGGARGRAIAQALSNQQSAPGSRVKP